jgi:hypothetical protein
LTEEHAIVGLTLLQCGGCARGRETGENGGHNAGNNVNKKATDEVERAQINTVKMKMLKEKGSGQSPYDPMA